MIGILLAESAGSTVTLADYSVPWFIAYPIVVIMGGAILALFKALLSANGKTSAKDVQTEVDHQKRIDRYAELLNQKDEALERCQNKRVEGMEKVVEAMTKSNERMNRVTQMLEALLGKLGV